MNGNVPTCACPSGYTGVQCETLVNPLTTPLTTPGTFTTTTSKPGTSKNKLLHLYI